MKNKSCMKMKKIHLIVASVFVIGLQCSLAVTVDAYTWYPYDGHEYALTQNYNNWEGAEAEAVSQGGHLATITDQNQVNFLINTFQNQYVNGYPGDATLSLFWIGLYNTSGNLSDYNAWQWSSGDNNTFWQSIRTTFWGWNFPDEYDHSCSGCGNCPKAYLHTKPHPYPGTINNDIRWETRAAAKGVIERISLPGAATQISPSGTITTGTPTYTWNAVSNATHYQLWVNGSGTWYPASAAGCGTGTCSITGSALTAGSYTWWVQTYNSSGVGAWSSGMSFTISGGVPGAATLISPSGTITTTTPTYMWNAVSNATWYHLWNGTGDTWHSASEAGCGSGTGICSITGSALTPGSYTWYVQTYNSYGIGAWSSGMGFTIATGGGVSGMVLIPAESFQMGDNFSEGSSDERPVHTVTVSTFYMDKYEVTKSLWDDVYTWATSHGYAFDNTGQGAGANYPVYNVSWYDVTKWLNARSEREGRTPVYYTDQSQTTVYRTGQINITNSAVKWPANGYRLPTEAEWEKACRGGLTGNHYPWPSSGGTYSQWISASMANYSTSATKPVGYYNGQQTPQGTDMANGFGLYDMAGNVWEWTWDWYSAYSSTTLMDPRGPESGTGRVLRSGSWWRNSSDLRCANRESIGPSPVWYIGDLGFRSALSQP